MHHTSLNRLVHPGVHGSQNLRHSTARPTGQSCSVRLQLAQGGATVSRTRRATPCHRLSALEPSLVGWLSSYGAHSEQLLHALDELEAHTCDDLQHLQKEDIDSLETDGQVARVQLSRLRAAIKADAYLRRWQGFTDSVGGSSGAAWTARNPAASSSPASESSATRDPPYSLNGQPFAAKDPHTAVTDMTAAAVHVSAAVPAHAQALPCVSPGWFDVAALGRHVRTLGADSKTSKIAFSPCGSYVAAGLDTGVVEIWDVSLDVMKARLVIDAELLQITKRNDHADDDDGLDFFLDWRDGDDEPHVQWMDDDTLTDWDDHIVQVTSLSWNADGRSLLVSTLTRMQLGNAYRVNVPLNLVPDALPSGKTTPETAFAFDHADFETGACIAIDVPILAATLSPDGRTMASVTRDGYVHVWDRVRGEWRSSGFLRFKTLEDEARSVALCACRDPAHPEGRRLLAALGGSSGVSVWDLSQSHLHCTADEAHTCADSALMPLVDGAVQKEATDHKVPVLSASADGKWLVAGFSDGKVRVYDMSKIERHKCSVHGVELSAAFTLQSSPIPVSAVAITSCGGGVIIASTNGLVVAMDASTGECKAVLSQPEKPSDAARDLALSADGTQAVVAFGNGNIVVWQIR